MPSGNIEDSPGTVWIQKAKSSRTFLPPVQGIPAGENNLRMVQVSLKFSKSGIQSPRRGTNFYLESTALSRSKSSILLVPFGGSPLTWCTWLTQHPLNGFRVSPPSGCFPGVYRKARWKRNRDLALVIMFFFPPCRPFGLKFSSCSLYFVLCARGSRACVASLWTESLWKEECNFESTVRDENSCEFSFCYGRDLFLANSFSMLLSLLRYKILVV